MMENVLNSWVSPEVLAVKNVGRTSVIFTKKALMNVLQQHSEEKGIEKTRLLNKIYFLWTDEVDKMGREIVEKVAWWAWAIQKKWSKTYRRSKEKIDFSFVFAMV